MVSESTRDDIHVPHHSANCPVACFASRKHFDISSPIRYACTTTASHSLIKIRTALTISTLPVNMFYLALPSSQGYLGQLYHCQRKTARPATTSSPSTHKRHVVCCIDCLSIWRHGLIRTTSVKHAVRSCSRGARAVVLAITRGQTARRVITKVITGAILHELMLGLSDHLYSHSHVGQMTSSS